MEVVVYSTHKFEKEFLERANAGKHRLKFLDVPLNKTTADLAEGATAVSIFVNDDASGEVLNKLKKAGVRFIVLRSAGYNNVDMEIVRQSGFRVARVPAYSPYVLCICL